MTDEISEKPKGQSGQPASWSRTALFGLCPRCGARSLYTGKLYQADIQFAPECSECRLDFGSFNVGDGPAAFLTLIIGAVMVGLAIWLDIAAAPPFWVHALIWVPLTAAAVIYGLRVGKAALLASEYNHDAHEAGTSDLRGADTDPEEEA